MEGIRPEDLSVDKLIARVSRGGIDEVTPGSNCMANLYSNHHDEIAAEGTSTARRIGLHVVDAPKDRDNDVIVAKGSSRKFTPVRHDGSLTGEGNSGRKAA